ncbi:DUF3182 family protein [Ramlibacter albus]|uniref:DUF3182 family protein n=1 Tax=Ramlibacter albus TaxID=2079448 RepID=A0A923MED1_9BURK|nr:DUF3182 family protein [Ramlibacter albus]
MQPQPQPGVVLALASEHPDELSEHQRCTLLGFVRQVAALRGERAGGFHHPGATHDERPFFVPQDTLTTEEAAALGIHGPQQLFGGVVPHAFVATKAISHALVDPGATCVHGWVHGLAAGIEACVLPGFTVFDQGDALTAGQRLLARGPVRLKPVRASGSRGQSVAQDDASLRRAVAQMDPHEIATHGLVVEVQVDELHTFSIGQVQVAGLTASYFGVQRSTRDNEGVSAYGGSSLTLVRGGYDALLALRPAPEVMHAIGQARCYDDAVSACYPGFHTSRSNCDVLLGRDASGTLLCGVLEPSWRVGGATGAELAALERFAADPGCKLVRASCHEVYGDSPEPPPSATVHYRGIDPRQGPLTKYTVLEDE